MPQFNIRLTPDDARRIDELAELHNVKGTAIVRMALKHLHDKALAERYADRDPAFSKRRWLSYRAGEAVH